MLGINSTVATVNYSTDYSAAMMVVNTLLACGGGVIILYSIFYVILLRLPYDPKKTVNISMFIEDLSGKSVFFLGP